MKPLFFLIAALLPIVGHAQQNTLSDGLQACYPLDCDNAVNQSLIGMLLDGQALNVTCTTDRNGNLNSAYQFAGNTGSKIKLPGMPPIKGQIMCISTWIKLSSLNGQTLIFTRNNAPTALNFDGYALGLLAINNVPRFIFQKTFYSPNANPPLGNFVLSLPGLTVLTNQWYHIVVYLDHAKVWMYVNGQLQGTNFSMVPTDYHPTKDVILGGTDEPWDAPFSGVMDDVRFYDRELLGTEVLALYQNNPTCSSPKPVGLPEGNLNSDLIHVYPNPGTGRFNIEHEQDVKLCVTDIAGKSLECNVTAISEKQSELSVNAVPGIYLVKVYNKDGQLLQSKKLIIQE